MTPSDQRSGYKYFVDITTRWMDNDIYGHVNNVVYYSYFDSVANQYLIEQGGLDIHSAEIIGFVVASSCEYKSPVPLICRLFVSYIAEMSHTPTTERESHCDHWFRVNNLKVLLIAPDYVILSRTTKN